jgi:tetratricopeptide (TPR) repeat protein
VIIGIRAPRQIGRPLLTGEDKFMEPEVDKGREADQGPDSSSAGDGATGTGVQRAGPQVIGTDDPAITPGPACPSTWMGQPEGTMSVETGRIRGPSEAFNPNIVLVPIASDRPRGDRAATQQSGKKQNENGNQNENKKQQEDGAEEGGKSHGEKKTHARNEQSRPAREHSENRDASANVRDKEGSKPAHQPSNMRILLYSGIVSLICGIVGAAGYSYFFGKSSDEKSSGKSSDSGKSSGSSKGPGASGENGSGDNSNSSKNSDPGRSSESSQNSSDSAKLLQAQAAWMTAVNELSEARAAEKTARRSEEQTKAVLDFLKNTLLSAGRPGSVSLTHAFWVAGQGKDLSLRKALEATEAQVKDAFTESPMSEATVREMLGLGYLSLGDAAQGVKQYERALALRQAMNGSHDPDTAACRNQLAVAYRLAGRDGEGGRLFEKSPDSTGHAQALALDGSMLLAEKKSAEAELKLRECLAMRQKLQPDDWTTFDTKSMLGEALLDQNKFKDAEPLLLSGYEGMKSHKDMIPTQDKPRLAKALDRLTKLYEEWGKKDSAARWRNELRQLGETG